MTVSEIEAQGAVFGILTEPRLLSCIQPSISWVESLDYIRAYFERRLLEDPDGKWSDSRYSAGWAIVNWFSRLRRDHDVPRSVVASEPLCERG
jgi:hypothetical protein